MFSASGGGVEVAVKVVSSMVRGAPNIVNEAEILKRLGPHSNIVAMYAHGYARTIIEGCGGLLSRLPWSYPARVPLDAYCVVLEKVSGGELYDRIARAGRPRPLEEAEARRIFGGIAAAVSHCHAHGIAHLDLKLENILLTEDGGVKLIDFGLSHAYRPRGDGGSRLDRARDPGYHRETPLQNLVGSSGYAAPEVWFNCGGYDGLTADVWSMGVILYLMLFGFFPFSRDDDAAFADAVNALNEAQRQGRGRSLLVAGSVREPPSPLAVELLDAMLTVKPSRRTKAKAVLGHQWLKRGDSTPLTERSLPAPTTPTKAVRVTEGLAPEGHGSPRSIMEDPFGAGKRKSI